MDVEPMDVESGECGERRCGRELGLHRVRQCHNYTGHVCHCTSTVHFEDVWVRQWLRTVLVCKKYKYVARSRKGARFRWAGDQEIEDCKLNSSVRRVLIQTDAEASAMLPGSGDSYFRAE
jgi:hypothetical protein